VFFAIGLHSTDNMSARGQQDSIHRKDSVEQLKHGRAATQCSHCTDGTSVHILYNKSSPSVGSPVEVLLTPGLLEEAQPLQVLLALLLEGSPVANSQANWVRWLPNCQKKHPPIGQIAHHPLPCGHWGAPSF